MYVLYCYIIFFYIYKNIVQIFTIQMRVSFTHLLFFFFFLLNLNHKSTFSTH